MDSYEIELRKRDGGRDCLLVIRCARDQQAIVFAKSVFRMNRGRAERVIVSCRDRDIFEEGRFQGIN
jgi:hypothetical protein